MRQAVGGSLPFVSRDLRIAGVKRPPDVDIAWEGRALRAPEGESLAAALLAAGVRRLGEGPGSPRAAFCMMGVCQQCLVRVDGRLAQACLVPVRAGLKAWPA
jgi:predicted molibdopterin-dependent oxidoreductase YjgC